MKKKTKQNKQKKKEKKTGGNKRDPFSWKRLFMHIIWIKTETNILGHTVIQIHVRQLGL